MFDTGNKIIITNSSIDKGKIGPRKGSVGYIIKKANKIIDIDQYYISVVSIIFYRFGNEKRQRTENRTVAFLFPNQLKDAKDFDVDTQQSFIHHTKKKNKLKQDLKNKFGTKTLCTLSPIYTNINGSNVSYEERVAYLLSLWTADKLLQCLYDLETVPWHHRYKVTGIKDIANILRQGLNDYGLKAKYTFEIAKSEDSYKEFIKAIKILTLRYSMGKPELYPTDSPAKIYKVLCSNLFNGNYNLLCKEYITCIKNNKVKSACVKDIIKNLNHMKYKIASIGEKYNITP